MNVTDNKIYAPLRLLNPGVRFHVEYDDIEPVLYTDDMMNCTIDGQPLDCKSTPHLELGHFVCSTELELESEHSSESIDLKLRFTRGPAINSTGITVIRKTVKINHSELESDADVWLDKENANIELFLAGNYICSSGQALSCVQKINKTTCYWQFANDAEYDLACTPTVAKGHTTEFTVDCREPGISRNTNPKSVMYIMRRIPGVSIVDSGPEGELDTIPILYAETSIPAECGYYQDLQLGTLAMEELTNTMHQAQVSTEKGTHRYHMICRDKWGNTDTETVEFYIIE